VSPLGERIAALIRLNGPMSIADYMALCLGDPEHGYYMRREPFGRAGDFITAPEVSQMFGELIGAWAIATWEAMGNPSRFVLAELGPGRGTLMKDMLRVARLRPAFLGAASLHLVEASPRLRDIQRETLAGSPVVWHARIEEIPAAPTILIANEFFDALPIRQFVRTAAGWAERVVGLADDGSLAFGLMPLKSADASPLSTLTTSSSGSTGGSGSAGQTSKEEASASDPPVKPGDDVGEGATVEFSPASVAVASALAARLAHNTGAALFIDYGYEGPAIGDTLQAVARHRYVPPLESPGEADLTAHVDFAALGQAARAAGAEPRPLVTQGEFLTRLGLDARAATLKRGKDPATIAAVDAAVARLAGPDAMGNLFKVLAISSRGLAVPAFEDKSGR
jgi:NADH dehydrogenase [ubiquinone] 1 alpha subcomplex assembly factor 7